MSLQITSEWNQLKHSVDKLELQLTSTAWPLPGPEMCELLILGEDRRFYFHPGIDPIALCRATWKTLCGSRQGASTIAMQIVRTITGRYEKTLGRKIREMILAVGLTQYVPKDRLPVIYLWIAYYGSGMINFRQACSRLHIAPHCIDSFEAAKLVARLKYPEPRQHDAERLRKISQRGLHLLALKKSAKESFMLYRTAKNGTI